MKKIAVITAHPDDETLGCGGTIAKLARQGGINLSVCALADGETSRSGGNIAKREEQYKKAFETLIGRRSEFFCVNFDFKDQRMDEAPFLDVVKAVERYISDFRPEIIYTHWIGDINRDHQITARAVLTACRPVNNCPVKAIYAFEIPGSTEWGWDDAFRPMVYETLAESDLDKKLAAFECFTDEVRKRPHPRSRQLLVEKAALRGSECGVDFAEAFHVYRERR